MKVRASPAGASRSIDEKAWSGSDIVIGEPAWSMKMGENSADVLIGEAPVVYENEGDDLVLENALTGRRNILDVGCGVGSNAKLLKLRNSAAKITSITPPRSWLAIT
jgi:hypothetical protein